MTKPEPIVLYRGGHDAGEGRYCWTEAIAYCAGEPHTARPRCLSPVSSMPF